MTNKTEPMCKNCKYYGVHPEINRVACCHPKPLLKDIACRKPDSYCPLQLANVVKELDMNGLKIETALIHCQVSDQQFKELEKEYISAYNPRGKIGLGQIGFDFNDVSIIVRPERYKQDNKDWF